MKAVVLFAGMGGATAGLAEAGLDVRLCVDGWQRACVAHRRWHPGMPVVRARCEDAHHVAPMAVDLVWASPSCKPYSTANRVAGRRGTDHPEHYPLSLLVEQMRAWQARWLVIENVPGLVWSVEGKAELGRFHAAVTAAGLVWNYTLLSAASCGVRQLRRRVVIVVGSRLVAIPDAIPNAIPDAPAFGDTGPGGGVLRTIMASSPSQYIRRDNAGLAPAVDARIPSRHANWTKAGRTVLGIGERNPWHAAPGAHREWPSKRAVTASGEGTSTSPHTGEVNWTGRTLAECAELQCVPMAPLEGVPRSVAHELVGNAVPPPMARVVAETLLRADADLRGAA